MKTTTTERQTLLFPTRIVKTKGSVTSPETLLIERAPIVVLKEQHFTRLEKKGEENPYVLLDFGREIHGSVRLNIANVTRGKNNHIIHLTFGESVSEALSKVGEKGATNDHSPRDFDVMISRLSNVEYGQTGFRFLRIELVEEGFVDIRNVVAICKTADIEQKGYFHSSDAEFDKILDVATYTCYLNLQDGVIWDGVKRDRLVWAGDLNSEILTLMYQYGDVENVRNSLDFLRDNTAEHCWMNTIPSYSAWWVFCHLNYYRFCADRDYLNENMDRINSILRDLDLCIEPDECDFSRTGDEGHMPYYLDWPTRDTDDAKPGTMLLIGMIAQTVLDIGAEGMDLAAAKSIVDKLAHYKNASVQMKQTVALRTVCGGRDPLACERLEAEGARGFSTFMSYFLLKGLSMAGSENAVKLAKEYYGAMLSRGATTFWEDFDMDWLEGSGRIDEEPKKGERDLHGDFGKYCYLGLRHSFCHGWASGVVAWAFEELAGIKVLEAGYKKVSIKPDLRELEWIDVKIPTPHGDIRVEARRGSEPKITLPAGVELVENA